MVEDLEMGRPEAERMTTEPALRNAQRKVSEVMRTDFRSCNASTSAEEVVTSLRLSGSRVLPVTEAQVPVGIVTEHGLATALAEHGANLSGLRAEDLMEREPLTVAMAEPIEKVVEPLEESRGAILAVNSEGLLKGIVTLSEIGPELTEGGLTRLVMKLQPFPAPAAAEEARVADPTAEIQSSKSQAQPHPWDSPTREHPAPIPLLSPSGLANPMLVAKDIMTASPRTCSPESTVLEAAAIFRDAGCGVVPVVEGGKPTGLLTDRDAILALPDREFELARTPVGEIMTRDLVTVEAEASLDEVLDRLGEADVRRLLVVDDRGHLTGLISWADLVPHVSERGLGRAVAGVLKDR